MAYEFKREVKTIDTINCNGRYVDASTIRRKIISVSAVVMAVACALLLLLI